ncbi:hypothetical protein FOMPIDRAFT_1054245 [Fomitopsis schrenkii]|uniref:Uncharacterized protein n=1 Tax=Fomitopsis schrenkii TaxID=2126942 RepID=S8DVY3_FOMSC|nr:hypothetical protein FOMPIDRAFT_1054245 [Fomitopsis schrenkii]
MGVQSNDRASLHPQGGRIHLTIESPTFHSKLLELGRLQATNLPHARRLSRQHRRDSYALYVVAKDWRPRTSDFIALLPTPVVHWGAAF